MESYSTKDYWTTVSAFYGREKTTLKRREISYRKIRTINYDQFWRDLENSRLVSDPLLLGLNLTDLVDLYNGTLKSLLDTHAPLVRKIVIIRPFSPWYTDDIRSEKRKCRAFERRWRAPRGDLDYQRYKEQSIIVNNKIMSAKVGFYSDLILENNCHQKTCLLLLIRYYIGSHLLTILVPARLIASWPTSSWNSSVIR